MTAQFPFKVETEEEKRARYVFSCLVNDPLLVGDILRIPLTQRELDYYSEKPSAYCERKGWRWMTLERMREFYCEGR